MLSTIDQVVNIEHENRFYRVNVNSRLELERTHHEFNQQNVSKKVII